MCGLNTIFMIHQHYIEQVFLEASLKNILQFQVMQFQRFTMTKCKFGMHKKSFEMNKNIFGVLDNKNGHFCKDKHCIISLKVGNYSLHKYLVLPITPCACKRVNELGCYAKKMHQITVQLISFKCLHTFIALISLSS